eukprot:Rhum_TRINITY_DN9326_c0_g1::Rhum_TRINITY_DN9326_c0_g1_i1::g.32973::m.32973
MKGAGYVVWMDETGTRGALRSDAVTRTARGGSVKAGMQERRKKADRWRVILGESGRPPPSPPSPPLPSSPLPTSASTVAAGAGFRDTGSQDERRRVIPDRRSEPATPGLAPPHLCSRCGLVIPGGERKALSHWVTSCLRHLTRLPPPATPLGGFPSAVADAEAGSGTVSSATQEALNPSLRLRPSRAQEQRSSGGSSAAAAAHHRRLTPTNLGDHASWDFSEVRLRNVVGAKHAFSVCSGFSAMPDAAATTAAGSRERSGSGTRSGSGGGLGRGCGASACSDEFEVFALRSEGGGGGGGGGGSDGYDDDEHDLFLRTCAGLGGDDPLSCTRVAAEDARMSALCEQIQEADAQLKRAVECVAQSFDIDALPVESRSEHLASLERLLQQLQPTPPQSPSAETASAAAAEEPRRRVVECSSAATQTQTPPEVAVAAPRRRPTIASLSAETLQRVFRGHAARQRLRLLARSLHAAEAAAVEEKAAEPAAAAAGPADVLAVAQGRRPVVPYYTTLLAAGCRAEHVFVGALVGRAPQAPRPAEASRVVVRRRPAAAVKRPVKLRPQTSDVPAAAV